MAPPIPITRAEYAAKFGAVPTPAANTNADWRFAPDGVLEMTTGSSFRDSAQPIPITRAEYAAKFGRNATGQSPLEVAVGGVGNLANAGTLGFGDEILSGLASPIAAGLSQFTDQPMGIQEAYSRILPDLRGDIAGFREENPIVATGQDIVGALTLPLGSFKAADGVLKTAAKLSAEGAAYGAGYGFGEGEGGLDSRLENALSDARNGAIGGALLGGSGKALAKGVGALAQNAPKWAQKASNEAFGASVADFTKSTRQDGLLRTKGGFKTELEQHFNTLRKNGILKGAKSAEDILQNHDAQSTPLAKQLNKYLNIADRNLKGKKVYPKQFTHAEAFITKRAPKDEVPTLKKELAKYIESLKTEGDGTIRELQDQKRILYNKVYPEGGKTREGLDQAIAEDLKVAIEAFTDSLLPKNLANAVKTTNRKLAPYEATRRLLETKVTQEATSKTHNKVKAFFRTSGGWGTPMLGGAYVAGIPGALVGAGLGKATQFGMSPAGSGLRATTHKHIGDAAKWAAKVGRKDRLLPAVGKISGSVADSASELLHSDKDSIPRQSKKGLLQSESLGMQQGTKPNQVVPLQRQLDTPSPLNDAAIPVPTQYEKQPISYTPKIIKEMTKELPPIVRAVMKVESNYNPRAVSKKGAQGLMQLMPAIQEAFGVTDPFDPVQNINAGIKLLQEESERFKDPRLALAAYNAGSPAVNRAIKKAGSRNYSAVAKFLPRETQQYTTKVFNEYRNLV